jgi:peptidoglycan hydrolase-like protein with peptidoglycan-binding domain
MKNDDVLTLQKFLVAQGLLATNNQTGYYGAITEQAVKQLQKNYSLISSTQAGDNTGGAGVVGPKTRELLNRLGAGNYTSTSAVAQTTSVQLTKSRQISTNMKIGSRISDVKIVQEVLVTEGLLAPQYVTGYFGTLTENAVKQLQKKYGLVTSGSPSTTGYGAVGPKTRQLINVILIR